MKSLGLLCQKLIVRSTLEKEPGNSHPMLSEIVPLEYLVNITKNIYTLPNVWQEKNFNHQI